MSKKRRVKLIGVWGTVAWVIGEFTVLPIVAIVVMGLRRPYGLGISEHDPDRGAIWIDTWLGLSCCPSFALWCMFALVCGAIYLTLSD